MSVSSRRVAVLIGFIWTWSTHSNRTDPITTNFKPSILGLKAVPALVMRWRLQQYGGKMDGREHQCRHCHLTIQPANTKTWING